MNDYRRDWSLRSSVIQQQNKKEETTEAKKLPATADPCWISRKLASRMGLTAGRTGLVSQWEAQNLAIAGLIGGRPRARLSLRLPDARPSSAGKCRWARRQLGLFLETARAKIRFRNSTQGRGRAGAAGVEDDNARPLALKQADALAAEAAKG